MKNYVNILENKLKIASVAIKAQIDDLLHNVEEVNRFLQYIDFTNSFPYEPYCFAEIVATSDKRVIVYKPDTWSESLMGRPCPKNIMLINIGLYADPIPEKYGETNPKLINKNGKLWIRKVVERELPVTKRTVLTHVINEFAIIIEHELMENLLLFDERILRPHE